MLHGAAEWSRKSVSHDLAYFADGPYDAYADGEGFDVRWLASAFLRASFIFNTRPLLPWLVSRFFHAQDSVHAVV